MDPPNLCLGVFPDLSRPVTSPVECEWATNPRDRNGSHGDVRVCASQEREESLEVEAEGG